MRDKGTNEIRATITDLSLSVIKLKVGCDPSLSQTAVVRDVLDDWARSTVIKALRKRDEANLMIERLKSYGIDPDAIRQESVNRLK